MAIKSIMTDGRHGLEKLPWPSSDMSLAGTQSSSISRTSTLHTYGKNSLRNASDTFKTPGSTAVYSSSNHPVTRMSLENAH